MLKLFRKIRIELLSTGNFKKYITYAVGEIFLVMIGILLALQVNNWNDSRKSKNQELELLESLYREFTFNRNELNRTIKKAQVIQKRCETILENTGKNKMKISEYESDSLINTGLLDITTFDAVNGILDDIINSGKPHVLKNQKLKNNIANWNATLADVKEDEGWAVNVRNSNSLPFIYSHSNYVNISQSYSKYNKIRSGFYIDYSNIYKLLEFENIVNGHRIWNIKNEYGYKNLVKWLMKSFCYVNRK